jgi:xylan 1,4-beta-xylosidase
MTKKLTRNNSYCNPLSIPNCPKGIDPPMYTKREKQRDYRSISDPSVLFYDNKWYLYPSYGMAFVSEDFASWKHYRLDPYYLGYSPAIIPYKGKFYLTAHSAPLYVGDNPLGPFRLIGDFIMPDGTTFRPVDPALFVDDDERVYMYWHDNKSDGEILLTYTVGAELDPKQLNRLLTQPKILHTFEPSHEWERFGERNQDTKFGWVEGQWMLKHNGRYYLIYAGCGTEYGTYAMGAYYSDVGPLDGFVYQKRNPIISNKYGLVRGTGHGCVVHGPNNTLWAFYTCSVRYEHLFERRIGMDPIGIDENGELFAYHVTDTPQWAPGIKEHPELDNDTGQYPLTLYNPVIATSAVEGRDEIYAVDESMLTWWQPKSDDPLKQLTVNLCAPYWVSASRVIWRDVGLDYENGILPGPFQYTIEACTDVKEENWINVLDLSNNTEDYNIDYRTFEPVKAYFVRLTIKGTPPGIEPGVISFTVFGERA